MFFRSLKLFIFPKYSLHAFRMILTIYSDYFLNWINSNSWFNAHNVP